LNDTQSRLVASSFFARHEASNYGSPHIEAEYLLLGLLRENRGLAKWFAAGKDVEPEIRAEIEKRITRGERFSESVEVPLSADCKRVLALPAESAERLGYATSSQNTS
jgi:ATP-dependent Clp protease ATP-binding subunit ClpC